MVVDPFSKVWIDLAASDGVLLDGEICGRCRYCGCVFPVSSLIPFGFGNYCCQSCKDGLGKK